jgi:hypothetical protein
LNSQEGIRGILIKKITVSLTLIGALAGGGCLPPKTVIAPPGRPSPVIAPAGLPEKPTPSEEEVRLERLIRRLEETEKRLLQTQQKTDEALKRVEKASKKTDEAVERINRAEEKIGAVEGKGAR